MPSYNLFNPNTNKLLCKRGKPVTIDNPSEDHKGNVVTVLYNLTGVRYKLKEVKP